MPTRSSGAALTLYLRVAQPRSYATPSKAAVASPEARALDFASPFSPAARADAGHEARLLTALNTRLKKRLDDVERTAVKCVNAAAGRDIACAPASKER